MQDAIYDVLTNSKELDHGHGIWDLNALLVDIMNKIEFITIMLDNHEMTFKDSVKYLRVTFREHLT